MSDLIDRQAAIDALKGLPTWWADSGGYYGGAQPPMVALLHPEDAVSAIENLPSAQPEIIRCEDCKYGEIDDPDFPNQYLCHWHGMDWNDGDHFCSHGVRSDKE